MIKIISAAFGAIAFYARALELGAPAALAVACGAMGGLGVYTVAWVIADEPTGKGSRKCRRKSDVQSARRDGVCREKRYDRTTYARYAQSNSDKPVRVSKCRGPERIHRHSYIHSRQEPPIRKICGVLSSDYYHLKEEDKRRIL